MRHALMAPVALLALGLTGCAGLTPLVDLTALKAPTGDDVSLAKAKDHARDVRDAYRRELLNHTRWRGAASNGLLGIGALALGGGLAKSHSSVFNGLAWAGATTYGASQLNLRPENEAIYVAGVQTLDCALAAVSPLDIGGGREARIDGARARLSKALAEHGVALGNFERASANDAALQQAKATASRGLIQPAQQQLAAANQLLGKVRRAGVELINAVDGIRSELDKTLLQTVPDPKAALAVVGALNDFAQLAIGGIRKVDAKQAAHFDGENKAQNRRVGGAVGQVRLQAAAPDGSDSLSALLLAEAELQMARDSLGVEMAGLDGEASLGAAAQCKLVGLPPALSASTASLKFSAKKADVQSVVALGGQPPFTGTLSGGADSGLSLVVPHPFDRRFDVRATDKVEAGEYELVIRDAMRWHRRRSGWPSMWGMHRLRVLRRRPRARGGKRWLPTAWIS